MELLKEELNRVVDYVAPYLQLANSHTVDFIVNDTWQRVIPEEIRIHSDRIEVHDVLDAFYRNDSSITNLIQQFIEQATEHELKHSRYFKPIDELNFPKNGSKSSVKITEFMSAKKLHEVESMSQFVADVASLSNTSLIVDIGSGKGYLTSVLALQHRFKILGIDCSQTNITGATKTTMKLEKKWKVYQRRSQNLTKEKPPPTNQVAKEPCSSNEEYHNKYKWKSAIVGDLYKQRVQSISKTTNMDDILSEEYPREDHQNVLLVGLHTCGNLAPACLELLVENRNRIKSIVNIGCCYHLLEEKFVSNPDWLKRNSVCGNPTFPMSEYLTERRFALGRDARMCGTQKPINLKDSDEITNATKPLFYRALLQKLMIEKLSADDFPQGMTGRIAHKCNTFREYLTKAEKKLDVNLQVNDQDLDSFVEQNTLHWDRLKIFFILKSALSPVIESIILLDRLLYLFENNISNAFVVRLFDPDVSPRCHAIVALPPSQL
ncbi:probable methyltransferase-like protein 25 [Planococcus citri]|uniref:probable methyltransferase-like protein 25 n=1 Tax=Planococcus citri TaxID=170843 RepID=UPI0031F806BE